MQFKVKRLRLEQDTTARYHLFTPQGALTLVAEYGTPWLDSDQVRFARPDGKTVAMLGLQRPQNYHWRKRIPTSIAHPLVYDHAVYALISQHAPILDSNKQKRHYLTIDVEERHFLVLSDAQDAASFHLYNYALTPLNFNPVLNVNTLPTPVGSLQPGEEKDNLLIDFASNGLKQAHLLFLALAFLIDHQSLVLSQKS